MNLRAYTWNKLNIGNLLVAAEDEDAARKLAIEFVQEHFEDECYPAHSKIADLRYDLRALADEPDSIDELDGFVTLLKEE